MLSAALLCSGCRLAPCWEHQQRLLCGCCERCCHVPRHDKQAATVTAGYSEVLSTRRPSALCLAAAQGVSAT